MTVSDTRTIRVGLVVLNYNNAYETVRFLERALSIESIDAIQVVDNASTDQSAEILSGFCRDNQTESICLAISEVNNGYGAGNNLGFSLLVANNDIDYLVVANPDTFFDNATIISLKECLEECADVVAVAPIMTKPSGETCQSAWSLPGRVDMIRNALRLIFPSLSDRCDYGFDYNAIKDLTYVDVLPGSLFMMRASVFASVGGFDEDTFLYGEENLLFAKIKQLQYKVALLPTCRYVHAHGSSINKEISSIKRRYRILLNSNLIYCRKILKSNALFIGVYKALFVFGINFFATFCWIKDKARHHILVGRNNG